MLQSKAAFETLIYGWFFTLSALVGVGVINQILYRFMNSTASQEYTTMSQERNHSKTHAPCILKIIPEFIFNKRNQLVFGVTVVEGTLHLGTSLCIPDKDNLEIGKCILERRVEY